MKKGAKRLLAVALAILMTFGVLSAASFAFNPQTEEGGTTLTIKTKIFREVPAGSGNWVETDKVRPGEPVKARVYLGTDYWTNAGDLIFFYDKSFFSTTFDEAALSVGPYYANTANGGVSGRFHGSASGSNAMNDLYEAGIIDATFVTSHNFVILSYDLGPRQNIKLDASKWFCEFDLTVSDDAPSSGGYVGYFGDTKGAFFTLTGAMRSPTNRGRAGINNVPKGSQGGNIYGDIYSMHLWDATIENDDPTNTDPDRSGPFPVELYTNFVTADFNPNGGRFSGGVASLHFEGEAGDPIDVEIPTKGSQTFRGWRVSGSGDEPADVTLLPATDTEYEAVWQEAEGNGQLQFRTEFYRFDPVTNDWVYTEKVKRGETVKARVYITTDYFTTSPDLLFFYDNDFFIDNLETKTVKDFTDTSPDGIANVNRFHGSSAAETNVTGQYMKITDWTDRLYTDPEEGLVTPHGYIHQNFAQKHTAITTGLHFNPDEAKTLYGGEHEVGAADQPDKNLWFVEFELKVLSDAGQLEEDHGSQPHDYAADFDKYWGRFFVKGDDGTQSGTIADPEFRPYGYVNVPYNQNEGDPSSKNKGMWLKKIDVETVDYPVCVVGSLTLHGGEHQAPCPHPGNGTFSSIPAGDADRVITHPEDDNTQYTVSGYIGDPITPDLIAEPEFADHIFLGWAPYYDPDNPTQILANPTAANIVELPEVMPYEDAEYQAVWAETVRVIYHPANGDPDIEIPNAPAGRPVDTEVVPYIVLPSDNPPGANPEKEGYTFVGWNEDPNDYTGVDDLPVTYPNGNTDYYAHYVAIPYSVKYYIIDPDTNTPKTLGAISLNVNDVIPRTPPAGFESQIPYGYTLVPDNVSPDPYKDAAFIFPLEAGATMPAASVDVYFRIATVKDIEADFDPAAGHFPSLDPNLHEHIIVPTDFGEWIVKPEDPVQDGHRFVGWTPDVGYMDDPNGKTFVAAYAPEEYITSYESVEGEIYYEVPGVYGEDFNAPEGEPEKDGYYFEGWALEDPGHPYNTTDNPPAIDDIDEFPPTVPLGDQTYIAVFTPVDCPLKFHPNEGEFDATTTTGTVTHIGGGVNPIMLNVPYDSNIDSVMPDPPPSKQGYDFKGWAKPKFALDEHGNIILEEGHRTYDTTATPLGINDEFGIPIYVEGPFVSSLGNMDDVEGKTFYALWEARSDTPYTVNVYEMKKDGTYPASPNNTYIRSGTTGQHVTYTPVLLDPNVFYVDAAAPDPVSNLEGDILADGSLVLNVFIGREGPVNVTFFANTDGGEAPAFGKFVVGETTTTKQEQTGLYYDADIAVPADPVREGYTFLGWFERTPDPDDPDESLCDNPAVIPAKVPNLPPDSSTGPFDPPVKFDYYAKWAIQRHTLIFDANGGEFAGTPPASTVTITGNYGTDIVEQLPADPEREGYTFGGYLRILPPDADAVLYQRGDLPATMPGEDQRYQAQWEIETYEDDAVTFHPNGGKFADITRTGGTEHTGCGTAPIDAGTAITFGADLTPYTPAPPPSRQGYTLAGWSRNSSATAPDANLGTMPDGNVTFYAVWTPDANNHYWLEYYHMKPDDGEYAAAPDLHPNGDGSTDPAATAIDRYGIGSGAGQMVTATTGQHVTAPIAPANSEYEPDYGHPDFKSQDIVADDGNTALKVYYKLKQYTFTVIVDSATTHTPYLVGAPVNAPTAPTKPGYDFDGWTFAPDTYTDAPATMPAEDVTMTATWKVHKWTVTYYKDANGVTEPVDVHDTFAEVQYGGDIPVPSTVPAAPDGFSFDGWEAFGDEGSLNGRSPDTIDAMPDRDLNFRAVWKADQAVEIHYTIEIYEQKLPPYPEEHSNPYDSANYEYIEEMTHTAHDGDSVSLLIPTARYGFAYNPDNPNNPDFPTIVHDDTVIKLYYDRATGPIPPGTGDGYPLRIHDQYGEVVNTILYCCGETIVLPATGGDRIPLLDETLGSPHDPTGDIPDSSPWPNHRLVGFDKDPDALNPNGFDYTTMPAFAVEDEIIGLDAYSVWELCKYELEFDPNGGTFADTTTTGDAEHTGGGTDPISLQIDFGALIGNYLPSPIPAKPGWTFLGWDDAKTEDEEHLNLPDDSFGTMDADGERFIAIWSQNEYRVVFNDYEFHEAPPAERIPCDDNERPSEPSTVTYEEIIDPFPDPAFGHPEYVTFLGWSTGKFDRDHIVDPETASIETLAPELPNNEVLNLYAVYERIEILLVPKDDSCTTVIERRFGDPLDPTYTYNAEHYEVQDGAFTDGISEHCWYVYGLKERVYDDQQASHSSFPKLSDFIKVKGDGRYEVEPVPEYASDFVAGTGAIIRVYDNVTGEQVEFFRIIVYGDVDGDAVVNASDSTLIREEVALYNWSQPGLDGYKAYKLKAADLNITASNPADPNDYRDRILTSADISIVEDHMLEGPHKINQAIGTTATT